MQKEKQCQCAICEQAFTALAIFTDADTDGEPDVFQGYQRVCAGCRDNPYPGIDRELLNAIELYCSGCTTRDELMRELDRYNDKKNAEAMAKLKK